MSEDQYRYVNWIYRCHRPLSEDQRRKWLRFYEVWFASAEFDKTRAGG